MDLAAKVMRAARFPFLATIDGDQPRVRPVSPVRTDGFTVYVANLRGYHKTAGDRGEPAGWSCATSTATTTRSASPASPRSSPTRPLLREIWDGNPLLRGYLGTIDNPELIVYRVAPERVPLHAGVGAGVSRGSDGAERRSSGGGLTTGRPPARACSSLSRAEAPPDRGGPRQCPTTARVCDASAAIDRFGPHHGVGGHPGLRCSEPGRGSTSAPSRLDSPEQGGPHEPPDAARDWLICRRGCRRPRSAGSTSTRASTWSCWAGSWVSPRTVRRSP